MSACQQREKGAPVIVSKFMLELIRGIEIFYLLNSPGEDKHNPTSIAGVTILLKFKTFSLQNYRRFLYYANSSKALHFQTKFA